MKIMIASEFRCTIYKGEYYLAPKAYYIYKRYADFFGDIILCSRFVEVDSVKEGYIKASFIERTIKIDNLYKVLLGFYDKKIQNAVSEAKLIIVRVPSVIAYRVANISMLLEKPVLAEAMADPWDGYWNHSFIGKIIAPYMTIEMKKIMIKSQYSIYVTEKYLQNRYPFSGKSINASNVTIKNVDDSILSKRLQKIKNIDKYNISLMTTAGIDVRAKGHKYVIKAMAELLKAGINIKYYLAGEGSKEYLKKIAEKYGVLNNVIFLGELSMDKVFYYLDNIDIYIQPSLQEGLPRAVIEAMSRGCPCLGAKTAGIPELLDDDCIFNRKSSQSIVEHILRLLDADLSVYAINNFEKSKSYLDSILNSRRNKFFEIIKRDIEG